MKKNLIIMACVVAGLSLPIIAQAYPGDEFTKEAKVTLEAARDIALKTFPGDVKEYELEKEAGGSGLRYSFVIVSHAVGHEVGIDAATGDVLENIPEGSNPD